MKAHPRRLGRIPATSFLVAMLLGAGCYCVLKPPTSEPRHLITLGSAQSFTPTQIKQIHDDFARGEIEDLDAAAAKDPGYDEWLDQLKSDIADAVQCLPVTYWSRDAQEQPIRLTGMLFLPRRWAVLPLPYYLPLIVYSHATELQRDRVPSVFGGSEWAVGAAAALYFNFAVAMPDLPGLGGADPPGYHPYCVAKPLAYSMVDMALAVQDAFRDELCGQYVWNGKLYVLGYSEGGYAAMAAVKELTVNADRYPGLPLTGAACLAGPFDLSGVMRHIMVASDQPYDEPLFVAYTAMAYSSVYGETFDPHQMLNAQLLPDIIQWMDGSRGFGSVNRLVAQRLGLPEGQRLLPRELLNADWGAAQLADGVYAATAAGQALIANDLWSGWSPNKPLLLRHSPDDELVPYSNSQMAFDAFTEAGAGPYLRFDPIGGPGEGIQHAVGGILSVPGAVVWFRNGCPMR